MEFLLGLFSGAIVAAIVFAVFHKQIAADLVAAEAKVKALEAKVLGKEKSVEASAEAIKKAL